MITAAFNITADAEIREVLLFFAVIALAVCTVLAFMARHWIAATLALGLTLGWLAALLA